MVDVADSKSAASDGVPVRVRSPAPKKKRESLGSLFFFAVDIPTDLNSVCSGLYFQGGFVSRKYRAPQTDTGAKTDPFL